MGREAGVRVVPVAWGAQRFTALRQAHGAFGGPWPPACRAWKDTGYCPPLSTLDPLQALFQDARAPCREMGPGWTPRPHPPGITGRPLTSPSPQVPLLMTPPPPPFPPPPLWAARGSPEDGRVGSGVASPACEYAPPGRTGPDQGARTGRCGPRPHGPLREGRGGRSCLPAATHSGRRGGWGPPSHPPAPASSRLPSGVFVVLM